MTSQQLFGLIARFDLYKDEIKTTPRSEILKDMRNRITIDRLNANINGQRRRGASALISFTISFEHKYPAIAQKVANELVTLFLDENIKTRTERASETTEFLQKESDRLKSEIEVMEEQIATYKQDNKGSLPENLRINLERAEELKVLLFSTGREIDKLQEDKKLLAIELDSVPSGLPTSSTTTDQLSPTAQLKQLQNQYVNLSARYGGSHPDLKAIKRKIKAFESEYGQLGDSSELKAQVEQEKLELAKLRQKYAADHPDVKNKQRKLQSLETMLVESGGSSGVGVNRESTQYRQLKAQLESARNNINKLSKIRLDLEKQIARLDVSITQTPQVERGLGALDRDYDNTRQKYQEIKSKQLQSELSKSLEEEQKGERFTLLEPPLFPDKPIKPNRPKLFLLGLILSVFSGIGVAFFAESLDGGIRGASALTIATQMRPLVTIPYISISQDTIIHKRNIKLGIMALMILGIVFIVMVHKFYKPLDLIWFILLRKLNLV
jgi:succinoglycan biosynthesis transport protein ExoP